MLPRDESLYKRIKMQQVVEQLITGTAQTTEHIITNNTGRSFLLLAQMQGGSGDINTSDGNTTWTESGSWGSYNYFSFIDRNPQILLFVAFFVYDSSG